MNKHHKLPFVVTLLGLMLLGAVLFVATHLVFRDQPAVQNVFSIIWTIALAVLIYRLVLNGRSADGSPGPGTLYDVVRFVMELLSVVTLLITAIMASVELSSPGGSSQLGFALGVTGFLAVVLLVFPRVLQMLKRRDQLGRSGTKGRQKIS